MHGLCHKVMVSDGECTVVVVDACARTAADWLVVRRRLSVREPRGAAERERRAGAAGGRSRVQQYQSQATTQI